MRSFGGRARQFQRMRRARPRRAPAATFPAPPCMTESFTGTSDTIGPDLAWTRMASGSNGGAAAVVLGAASNQTGTVNTTTAVASDPPLVVRNGVLTLEAPDLSLLPAAVTDPTGYWSRLQGAAVTDDELGDLDMIVSVTIASAPPLGTSDGDSMLWAGVDLYARYDGPDVSPSSGNGAYWDFFYANYQRSEIGTFAAGGGGPDPAEVDQQGAAALFLSFPNGDDFATYVGEGLGFPLLVNGDVVSITVTGTGAATHVICKVNDDVIFDVDGIDFDDWESAPNDPHDLDTDLPAASRAAVRLSAVASDVDTGPGNWHGPWNPGDLDETFAVDNFEVCGA